MQKMTILRHLALRAAVLGSASVTERRAFTSLCPRKHVASAAAEPNDLDSPCDDSAGCCLPSATLSRILEKRGISISSATKISKRVSSGTEVEVNTRLDTLEKVGLSAKDLERLMLSTAPLLAVDVEHRLEALTSCFRDCGVGMDVCAKLLKHQGWWIFSADDSRYRVSVENLRALVPVYKNLGLPQSKLERWVLQAPYQLYSSSEDKIEKAMQFLREFVGNETDFRKMVHRHPGILQYDVDRHLIPRLDFFRSIGLTEDQLVKVMVTYPKLLALAREQNIKSKLGFLEDLGISQKEAAKILVSFPRLPTTSCELYAKKVDFFMSYCGMDKHNVHLIFKRSPSLLSLSIENQLKPKVAFFACAGIQGKDLVQLLSTHSDVLVKPVEVLEARYSRLLQFGFTQSECSELIRRQPSTLNLCDDLLEKKMAFLINFMKFPVSMLTAFSSYLTYSLEGRIRPRMQFLAWMYMSGLARKEYYAGSLLGISETAFQKRFVLANNAAEIYTEFLPVIAKRMAALDHGGVCPSMVPFG